MHCGRTPTRTGDINGDNAVTEQQQDRNGTAAESGVGSVRGVVGAMGGGTGGVRNGGVQEAGAARQHLLRYEIPYA